MHLWPQIAFLCLTLIRYGVVLAKYGEKRESTYNWADFFASGVMLTILYYGGFFAPLGVTP
jgi:predicted Na+-dependent transporter